MWRFCVGLIIIAFTLPFLGPLMSALGTAILAVIAVVILVFLIFISWSWVIEPFMAFMKTRDAVPANEPDIEEPPPATGRRFTRSQSPIINNEGGSKDGD